MHLTLIRLAFFYLLAGMLLGIAGPLAKASALVCIVAVALLYAAVLRLRAS